MKRGDIVKIKYTKELESIGLAELAGRKAMIAMIVMDDNGKRKGIYAIPRTGKFKGEEWYIPISSVESEDRIDYLRSKEIIKKTVL